MRIDCIGAIVIVYIVGLYEVIWKYRDKGKQQWKLLLYYDGNDFTNSRHSSCLDFDFGLTQLKCALTATAPGNSLPSTN